MHVESVETAHGVRILDAVNRQEHVLLDEHILCQDRVPLEKVTFTLNHALLDLVWQIFHFFEVFLADFEVSHHLS